jgi:hypothetical protein
MTELVKHPTDQQVWDFCGGSGNARATYSRAFASQEKRKQLELQRTENNAGAGFTPRSASRYNEPDDPRVVAELTRRRNQIFTGGIITSDDSQPSNLIPALSPEDERKAAEGYWWVMYPHHGASEAEKGLLSFARALHLLPDTAVFKEKTDPIRLLAIKLVQSEEAKRRFAGRY